MAEVPEPAFPWPRIHTPPDPVWRPLFHLIALLASMGVMVLLGGGLLAFGRLAVLLGFAAGGWIGIIGLMVLLGFVLSLLGHIPLALFLALLRKRGSAGWLMVAALSVSIGLIWAHFLALPLALPYAAIAGMVQALSYRILLEKWPG